MKISDIGIITPYNAQKLKLFDKFYAQKFEDLKKKHNELSSKNLENNSEKSKLTKKSFEPINEQKRMQKLLEDLSQLKKKNEENIKSCDENQKKF